MRPIFGFWVCLSFFAHALAAQEVVSLRDSVGTRAPMIHAQAGWGMPVLDGKVGWGPGVGLGWEVEPGVPLYVGVDMAMHFFKDGSPSSPTRVETSSLQLLPTFYYHFLFPLVPGSVPFLGLSVGPNIQVKRTYSATGEVSESNIFAEALVRTGIHFVLSDDTAVTVESKAGLLSSKLIVLPQVNLIWVL